MERILDIELYDVKIPIIKGVSGWKEIEIKECGEPLVLLNVRTPDKIVVDSQYYALGIDNASPNLYARQGVANRLVVAASLLPPYHKLLIWDAWRPLEVQQALFNNYLEKLRSSYPDKQDTELLELAQTYVSQPSADVTKPSPHYTGGAVDLSILDPDDNPLNMGTNFDFFDPEAATRYFEDTFITIDKHEIRDNRRMLFTVMTRAGFSGYDEEWWHYDFGNQFDAARSEKGNAIYGGISLSNRSI